MTDQLIQLGVAGMTLGILLIAVKYFVTAITKKDDYLQKITAEFSVVIANHLEHNTHALTKFGKSIDGLAKAVNRLKR